MKQFSLALLLALTAFGIAQSEQEVEYGVLQLGPTHYTWVTDSGGSYLFDPAQLIKSMTNSAVDISSLSEHQRDTFARAPESVFLNHLAGWGWRLVAAIPYPEGGAQYIFERECNYEPSGCYDE